MNSCACLLYTSRLKRNYSFIFIIILVAWVTKIFMHAKAPIKGFGSFYDALAVGGFPKWLVATIFAGTLLTVIGINIYIAKNSAGEISEFGTHRSAWRI